MEEILDLDTSTRYKAEVFSFNFAPCIAYKRYCIISYYSDPIHPEWVTLTNKTSPNVKIVRYKGLEYKTFFIEGTLIFGDESLL